LLFGAETSAQVWVTVDAFSRGKESSLSSTYIRVARAHCLSLFRQAVCCAFALALLRAGRSKLARMAMTAMTTSNSIKVKACPTLKRWICLAWHGQGESESARGLAQSKSWRHLLWQ